MNEYVAGVEVNNKIEITIDTSKPIELCDFTRAMDAIGETFYDVATKERSQDSFKPTIYLSEVRKGSYVLDLVCAAIPTIPILLQGGICSATYDIIKSYTMRLIKGEPIQNETDKKLYKKSAAIINPIAKDNGSQIFIKNYNDNRIMHEFNVVSSDAKIGMYNMSELLKQDSSSQFYRQVPMTWVQANFDSNKSGSKAKFESINPLPLKVIFDNYSLKESMTSVHPDFGEPWQDLIYVVDVIVDMVEGEPKFYRILKNYPELTESKK